MWLALLGAAFAWAADGPFAGAEACRTCHPKQFESQSASGHALSLHSAASHPSRARFGPQSVERGPFRYSWRGKDLLIAKGTEQAAFPVEWAFGSGRHGVTFVSRADAASFVELALTFYPRENSFLLTPGHEQLHPQSAREAAGQYFRSKPPGFHIGRCFECHSTGPVRITAESVVLNEQGVRCETCHGAARAHAADPSIKGSVRGRKGIDGEEANAFCGGCHRAFTGDASNDFSDPWNVRHQPPYLEQSRCFQSSAGRLSCVTCHDPHGSLARTAMSHYNSQCTACHAIRPNVCKQDCVGCHMPLVRANQRLAFRNHWIGVYGNKSNLIPAR